MAKRETNDGARSSRLVSFALVAGALWLGASALLGAADWSRWRAPLDSSLVYGPTLEGRTDAILGAYAPVVAALEESVSAGAFVIMALPGEPTDPATLFALRLSSQLGLFVLPLTLVPTEPTRWRERSAEFGAGAEVFVLDLLNLVPADDDLVEVSRSAVHVLWRVVEHG